MAELLCTERMGEHSEWTFAEFDPTILHDRRVLDNLLAAESRYVPRCNYFNQVQPELRPFMRKVVATWMLEVCEEERTEPQVFTIAINFLDRFLCECRIDKTQLQMIACVCLLMASKVRQCSAISIHKLVYFTDYSVTAEQIRQFEVIVLAHLKWDLSAVTGYDLVDHVLERITWSRDQYPLVRRHARTLVDLCYVEPTMILSSPAVIASGCLLAAARGLNVPGATASSVCDLTRCSIKEVEDSAAYVDSLMLSALPAAPRLPPSPPHAPSKTAPPSDDPRHPETPTDVQDIFF